MGRIFEPASNTANSAPLPFEQKVELEGVTISVTAVPDVFPEGAALRVSDVIEDGIAQAARAAAEAVMSGEVKHHLISIEVVDRNWNLCAPNGEMEFPLMTVEGLVFDGAIRVMVYDQKAGQGREIETIEINRVEKTLRFNFVDSAVYDVVEERKDEGTGNNEDEGKGEEDEGTGNSEQE